VLADLESSDVVVLTLTFTDAGDLRALFDSQLSKKRAFVPGADDVAEQEPCALVLEHADRTFTIVADVVYVKGEEPGLGVGLQLTSLDEATMGELRAFVDAAEASPDVPGVPDVSEAPAKSEADAAASADGDDDDDDDEDEREPVHLHERIRTLSGPEQLKMAANGTLAERVALERMYGPNVWETLLKNPRITIPEVARIARKGTLSRPLVELIGAGSAWLAAGEVQRALLSNPRATAPVIDKIFRVMPRRDLARVPQQTAYPMTVRVAAKKLLDERG
jgi:hypothetical protein